MKIADLSSSSQAKYVETEYGEKFWYYEWKIRLCAGILPGEYYINAPVAYNNETATANHRIFID